MQNLKRLIKTIGFSFGLVLASASQASVIDQGSYTFTDSDPSLAIRLFRNDVPSEWGSNKPFPGTFGTGPYAYHLITINSGSTPFLQVTFSNPLTQFQVQALLYDMSFSPSNLSQGFLADSGRSALGLLSSSFRYQGVANTDYTLLLLDTLAGEKGTIDYRVEGFTSASAVPLPGTAFLIGAALLSLGIARRQKQLVKS